MDVIVVGAGLAGLIAATRLARAGCSVTVLERSEGPGGRATTTREEGYSFNLGPHALYAGGALATALGDLGVRWSGRDPGADGRVLWKGDLHALPGTPWTFLTSTALDTKGRFAAASLVRRLLLDDVGELRDVPVARWIEGVDDPGARALGLALIRVSTYCNDPERLSAGLAVAQVRSALRHGVRYLDGGWGTLVEGLVGAATAAGVKLRFHADVQEVRPGGVRVGETWEEAAAVLLALPLPAARRLLPTLPASPPVRAACLDLALSPGYLMEHRFILGMDRPFYLVVHSATARLAPEGGALVHVAQYLGPEEHGDVTDLEALTDRALPGWRDHVVHRRFLPSLHAASATSLAGVARPDVRVTPGIWVAGDWVGETGLIADASAASATRAAAAILETR